MKTEQRRNSVLWYVILVIGISYLLAGIYRIVFPEKNQVSYMILGIVYMYMPFLSALIVDKLIVKRNNLKSWAINFKPNWWYLAAWPGVIVVAYIVLAGNLAWPGVSYSPTMDGFWQKMGEQLTPDQIELQRAKMDALPIPYMYIMLLQALFAGISVNALAAFGEETGWRGFMVREYKNLKFWNAALRIGIIWGIWHAPLILMGHNYPQHNYIGVGMMVVWCILLSPLFLYIRLKSYSTIATCIMHGTLNASAGLPILYLVGGNDLTNGFTGFAGFIVLIFVIAIMVLYDQKFSKHPITKKTILESATQH